MPDPEFVLLGDAIWLDFVNTARGTLPDPPDRLDTPAAYHRWTKALKLVSDTDTFDEVLAFRARLTELGEALATGRQPAGSMIQAINEVLARSEGHRQLTRVGGAWSVHFVERDQLQGLDAIARSAADSLADDSRLIRRCAAADCNLFFAAPVADDRRSWCSAERCGRRIERRRSVR